MSPFDTESWLQAASERAADADAIFDGRGSSVGTVYMAGYAVECSLKAYLQHLQLGFPKAGSKGHDLRELWRTANLRLCDLNDQNGSRAYYLNKWSTDLRYEIELPPEQTVKDLLDGARHLVGWIRKQIKRAKRTPQRRRQ